MTHAAVLRERRAAAPRRERQRASRPARSERLSVDVYRGGDLDFALHRDTVGPRSAVFTEPTTAREIAELMDDGAVSGVSIGVATDPYPPLERRHGRTRAILETLRVYEGLTVSITTKSTLVTRDLDLLVELSERHRVAVELAIPTVDRRLGAALERGAPRPDLRLKTISELAAARVPVGALVAPVLPDLTDDAGALDALASAAAGAGAGWLTARPLLLMPRALAVFFPYLEEAFPDRVERYRERYASSAYLPDVYARGLEAMVVRLRAKHDLGAGPEAPERDFLPRGPQLDLF